MKIRNLVNDIQQLIDTIFVDCEGAQCYKNGLTDALKIVKKHGTDSDSLTRPQKNKISKSLFKVSLKQAFDYKHVRYGFWHWLLGRSTAYITKRYWLYANTRYILAENSVEAISKYSKLYRTQYDRPLIYLIGKKGGDLTKLKYSSRGCERLELENVRRLTARVVCHIYDGTERLEDIVSNISEEDLKEWLMDGCILNLREK